jgi:hypothetical protein
MLYIKNECILESGTILKNKLNFLLKSIKYMIEMNTKPSYNGMIIYKV